jgi:hypothetical protein
MTSNMDMYRNAWKLNHNVQILYLRISAYLQKSLNIANNQDMNAPFEDFRECVFIVGFKMKVASVIAHLINIKDMVMEAYPKYCAQYCDEKGIEKERGIGIGIGIGVEKESAPEYPFDEIIRRIQGIRSKQFGDKEKYAECEVIYAMINNLIKNN